MAALSLTGHAAPRVRHVISSLHQGGSERQALQLLRHLKSSGRYDISLASMDPTGILRQEATALIGTIPSYPLVSFYHPSTLVQLKRFAHDLQKDCVSIVQSHDFYSNVFAMAGATIAGARVRIAARREVGGVRTEAQKVVERLAYRLASAIVANAEAVADQLVHEGVSREKIAVVYNGIEMARVTLPATARKSELLTSLGLPSSTEECRFVTVVANMRLQVKDQETFLSAAKLVVERLADTRFLLVGEGPRGQMLRTFADHLGIGSQVFFLGRAERIPEVLALSDVCVLSSRAEGMPNVVLEYMAAGRPVVSTDVGGVKEMLTDGKSGYLVAPGDPAHMARAILELLESPSRARAMGDEGRRDVEQRFSCLAQLHATEALYDRLLNRNAHA